MKIFKGYVNNHNRPEASIVERYITEEAIEFCSTYFSEAKSIGIPKSRHADRYEGKGTQGSNVFSIPQDIVLQAHLYILNNVDKVGPYFSTHKTVIKEKYPRISDKWLLKKYNKNLM